MNKKALLFLLSGCLLMQSCATIFGGPISDCQQKKPAQGEPRRKIRPIPLAADIIIYAPATAVDFLTGAIYKPCDGTNRLYKYNEERKRMLQDGYKTKGKDEFSLGLGAVSYSETTGWMGPPKLSGYISEPSLQTGALYFTYRHFLSDNFALGITGGIDNEDGYISYGNPKGHWGFDGTSGHYELHTYTLALETIFVYRKTRQKMVYGLLGAGVTYFDDNCVIYDNAPLGAPVPLPSNPYDYRTAMFNFQITPLGIRWGDNIGGFFELGFGYKGIVNGGISGRL